MKLFSLFIFITVMASNALAGEVVCKGGLTYKGINNLSTLESGEYDPTLLYGLSDNEAVGTYAFIVKKIDSTLDLVITSEDSTVVARSISKTTETSLTANIGKGYSASIFCSDK